MKKELNQQGQAAPQPDNLEALSLMERSVWMLAEYEGFSADDIAEITGLSPSAATRTLEAAREKMAPPAANKPGGFGIRLFSYRSLAIAAALSLLIYGFWRKQTPADTAPLVHHSPTLPQATQTTPSQNIAPVATNNSAPEAISAVPPAKNLKSAKYKPETLQNPTTTSANNNSNNVIAGAGLPIQEITPQTEPEKQHITVRPGIIALLPGSLQAVSSSAMSSIQPIAIAAVQPNTDIAQQSTFSRLRHALTPRSLTDAEGNFNVDVEINIPSIVVGSPGR